MTTDGPPWVGTGRPVFQRNRADAGFDRTQNLQMGWLYELPFGKGKMLAKSGVCRGDPRWMAGEWHHRRLHRHAIHRTVRRVPRSTHPNNTQTADQVNPTVPRLGNVGPGQLYYDPTAFAAVTGVRFGSSGRNILRNPGVFNTDLDITRYFPIKERLKLQFRAQFFNLANTSHFGGVSTSVTLHQLHADHQRLG